MTAFFPFCVCWSMNIYLKEIILIIVCYLIGSFSFAAFFSKIYRKIDIYKSGDFTPDAGNVYRTVSKLLGILVWVMDFVRVYIIVWAIGYFLLPSYPILVLLVGFALIIGHYFPILHKFIGGHEEITYVAFLLYFAPLSTLCIIILSLLVIFIFKQLRFAKYMIVILPPILSYILNYFFATNKFAKIDVKYLFLTSICIGIISFLVSRKSRSV